MERMPAYKVDQHTNATSEDSVSLSAAAIPSQSACGFVWSRMLLSFGLEENRRNKSRLNIDLLDSLGMSNNKS